MKQFKSSDSHKFYPLVRSPESGLIWSTTSFENNSFTSGMSTATLM